MFQTSGANINRDERKIYYVGMFTVIRDFLWHGKFQNLQNIDTAAGNVMKMFMHIVCAKQN